MTRSTLTRRLSLLALLVLIAAGCGDDDKGTTPCVGDPGNPATMPLGVGSRWVYSITETSGGDLDTYDRTDEITGTEGIEGATYALMQTIITEGVNADPDTTESYLRQVGQELFAYQEFDTSGSGGGEIGDYIFGSLMESMPWKVAEFTSTPCDSWTLLDTSNIFPIEGAGQLKVELKITASNEGRTEVTVPSGTYSDVYTAKFVVEVILVQNTPPLPPIQRSETHAQWLYLKDGVGIVKEETESRVNQTGDTPATATSVSVLESFVLAP